MEAAFFQRLERLLAVHIIVAAIPDHDSAAAVVALRDHALEILVIDRVILDLDREMFFAPLPGDALGHGPGFQNAVHLQPEIVVQPARVMFLNDEARRARDPLRPRLFLRAARLGGDGKISFPLVFGQTHFFLRLPPKNENATAIARIAVALIFADAFA